MIEAEFGFFEMQVESPVGTPLNLASLLFAKLQKLSMPRKSARSGDDLRRINGLVQSIQAPFEPRQKNT
jgi:hypothetical protein